MATTTMLPLVVDPLLVDPLLAPAPEVDPLALMADCITADIIEPDCISPSALTTLYSEDDMSMAPSSPHEQLQEEYLRLLDDFQRVDAVSVLPPPLVSRPVFPTASTPVDETPLVFFPPEEETVDSKEGILKPAAAAASRLRAPRRRAAAAAAAIAAAAAASEEEETELLGSSLPSAADLLVHLSKGQLQRSLAQVNMDQSLRTVRRRGFKGKGRRLTHEEKRCANRINSALVRARAKLRNEALVGRIERLDLENTELHQQALKLQDQRHALLAQVAQLLS